MDILRGGSEVESTTPDLLWLAFLRCSSELSHSGLKKHSESAKGSLSARTGMEQSPEKRPTKKPVKLDLGNCHSVSEQRITGFLSLLLR